MTRAEAQTAKRPVRRHRAGAIDYTLVFVVIALLCFGLLMVYSTSYYTAQSQLGDGSYYLRKQAIISLAAVVIMLVVSFIPYDKIITYLPIIGIVLALVLMVAVNFTSLGIEVNGRKRWLGIGSLSFQPTEFVKLAVIIFTAYYVTIHKNDPEDKKYYGIFIAIVGLPLLLVTMNNLSSGIIIFLTAYAMIIVASDKRKRYVWLTVGILGFVVLAALFGEVFVDLGLLKKYQWERVYVWKDPSAYSAEGGYQVLQGLYAIGSGGFFGKGLGNSTQKLGFVPEASNDMIFSIICEELGIFGAICLIALFVVLIYRMLKIAKRTRRYKGFYYVVGVVVHLSLQVILNIAVVTNAIPNTGVTLPFISYGGTSVIFLLIEIGIVLSIGRSWREEEIEYKRREIERNQ